MDSATPLGVDVVLVNGHKYVPADGSTRPVPPDDGLTYSLCGRCGAVTVDSLWEGFNADDASEKVRAAHSDDPHWLRCPACEFDHTDLDDDPGVWSGTFAEMLAEQERLMTENGWWHP